MPVVKTIKDEKVISVNSNVKHEKTCLINQFKDTIYQTEIFIISKALKVRRDMFEKKHF